MKFEQVFGKHKVVVVNLEHPSFKVEEVSSPKIVKLNIENQKIIWCFELPIPINEAFELVNTYQECVALANTKNLSVDLLLELGYNVVK